MLKMKTIIRLTLLILASHICLISGHARFEEPPARSTLWRFKSGEPINYNDNELNCGGFGHQYNAANNGKCGLCGDPYDSSRPNEMGPGSVYANSVISGTYKRGEVITATVVVTASHLGYFEFKICPVSSPGVEVTQECLDQRLLTQPKGDTKYYFGNEAGKYSVSLQLPADLVCDHCVLQFRYRCGNNWGSDTEGTGLGFGPQEEFRGCSDVRIIDTADGTVTPKNQETTAQPTTMSTTKPTTPSTTTTTMSTTKPTTQSTTTTTMSTTKTTTQSTTTTVVAGSGPKGCYAVGPLAIVPGMNTWCETNCHHIPAYCPSQLCKCN